MAFGIEESKRIAQLLLNAHQGDQARIDLSHIAKGIYMMHIEANGGQTVRKIVVE